MSDNVTYIDEYRPHLSIRGPTGTFHIISEDALIRMAKGEIPLEGNDDMILGIIHDFLLDLGIEI